MAYINSKIQMQKKIKDTLSFWVWLVPAGGAWCVVRGAIERSCCSSCYSPFYVNTNLNTERDYERDYQATLPQGRTAADG